MTLVGGDILGMTWPLLDLVRHLLSLVRMSQLAYLNFWFHYSWMIWLSFFLTHELRAAFDCSSFLIRSCVLFWYSSRFVATSIYRSFLFGLARLCLETCPCKNSVPFGISMYWQSFLWIIIYCVITTYQLLFFVIEIGVMFEWEWSNTTSRCHYETQGKTTFFFLNFFLLFILLFSVCSCFYKSQSYWQLCFCQVFHC